MSDEKIVQWLSRNREPQHPFNRDHMWGIDVVLEPELHAKMTCLVELPWPAPHVGMWFVLCERCGSRNIITAAGRVDDPRSVRLPCKKVKLDA